MDAIEKMVDEYESEIARLQVETQTMFMRGFLIAFILSAIIWMVIFQWIW